jgi:hypothetical protein
MSKDGRKDERMSKGRKGKGRKVKEGRWRKEGRKEGRKEERRKVKEGGRRKE